jgi:putative ABC transport system permease protein
MKDKDGLPFADTSMLVAVPAMRRENHLMGNVVLRGFGAKGIALRPEIKITEGRMFNPGKRELIAGVGARSQYVGLELGQKIAMPDGEWPVVGIFDTNGTTLDGNLIADVEPALASVRRNYFSGVLLRLDPAPGSFQKLKSALTSNPALSLQVERQTEYYARQNQQFTPVTVIAYFVGGMMAIGALFGALNTMYAAVSNRTREIATMRALGFGAFPVAVSVIVESLVLAVTGALIGAGIAWLLYSGSEGLSGAQYFHMAVTPGLIALGLIWAIVIALLGGLFPSIRAARLPIVAGLRAT